MLLTRPFLYVFSGLILLNSSSYTYAQQSPTTITFGEIPTAVAVPYSTAQSGFVVAYPPVNCGGYALSYGLAVDGGFAYGGIYVPPQPYLLGCPLPSGIQAHLSCTNGASYSIDVVITGYCPLLPPKSAVLEADVEQLLRSQAQNLLICSALIVGGVEFPPLLTGFCGGLGNTALWTYRILTDPPDPNYKVLAVLSIPPFTPVSDPSLSQAQLAVVNAALLNINTTAGVAQALYTSMNRAQGALAAGDSYWITQQLAAEAQWSNQLASYLAGQNYIGSGLSSALTAAGLSNLVSTADVISTQNQLSQSGFPALILNQLLQNSATSSEISALLTLTTQLNPANLSGTYASAIASALQSGSTESQAFTGYAASLPTTVVPGDLNGDLITNCADIAIVKNSFTLHAGYPGFDPRADTNLDGVVDVRDLAFVSRYLPAGTSCH